MTYLTYLLPSLYIPTHVWGPLPPPTPPYPPAESKEEREGTTRRVFVALLAPLRAAGGSVARGYGAPVGGGAVGLIAASPVALRASMVCPR